MPFKIYLILIDYDITMPTWVLQTHRLMDVWRIVPYAHLLKFIKNLRVLSDQEIIELVVEAKLYEVVLEDPIRNANDVHLIEDEE